MFIPLTALFPLAFAILFGVPGSLYLMYITSDDKEIKNNEPGNLFQNLKGRLFAASILSPFVLFFYGVFILFFILLNLYAMFVIWLNKHFPEYP